MCLGALVHGGVPLEYLQQQLARLPLGDDEYQLTAQPLHHNGQQAIKVNVQLNAQTHPPHRHLGTIQTLIKTAALPPRVMDWSLRVFEQLAIAEAAVHGSTIEQVHFHEVGATDAIVDIVGTCLGLDWLGIEQIHCGALPTGGGTVKAAHGRLPVPVPAVLKLWETRQIPLYHNGIEQELVTPTGAALMVTLAETFGSPPPLRLHKVGLGAGTRSLPIPNILRLWLGEPTASEIHKAKPKHSGVGVGFKPVSTEDRRLGVNHSDQGSECLTEQVMVLETQIDDGSPQGLAYAMEQLFAAGALDVFAQAIAMKKSRLGTLVTVICPSDRALACEQILFQETPTLGIRRQRQERHILAREIVTVTTDYGTVRVKVARQQNQIFNVQPEYADCAQIARSSGQPWQTIQRLAIAAWHNLDNDASRKTD